MTLTKYTNAGIRKSKQEDTGCKTCLDGKRFEAEQRFKTDYLCSDYFEAGCQECETLYKVPYVDVGIRVDAVPGERITAEKYVKWAQTNDGSLREKNITYHALKIGLDMNDQVIQMETTEIDIATLKDQYEKTGECKRHLDIDSKPFKTAEGEFVIKSCAICKQGTVTHRGKVFEDDIMNLVRYLAWSGQDYERRLSLDSLGLFEGLEEVPDLFSDIPDLFGEDVVAQTNGTPVLSWEVN